MRAARLFEHFEDSEQQYSRPQAKHERIYLRASSPVVAEEGKPWRRRRGRRKRKRRRERWARLSLEKQGHTRLSLPNSIALAAIPGSPGGVGA